MAGTSGKGIRRWAFGAMVLFVIGGTVAIGKTYQLSRDLSREQETNERQQTDLAAAASEALNAGEANRQTLCAAARIVSYNPLAQLPGETEKRFHRRIEAYRYFLRLSRGIDCHAVLAAIVRASKEAGTDGVTPSLGETGNTHGVPSPPAPPPPQRKPKPKPVTPSPQPPVSPGNSDLCERNPLLPPCLRGSLDDVLGGLGP